MSIDYTKVIADAIFDLSLRTAGDCDYDDMGESAMTARVTALCPDCDGSGYKPMGSMLRGMYVCDHPNAPTIGRMLRIAEAVLTAEDHDDGYVYIPEHLGGGSEYGGWQVINELRAVE